MFKVLSKNIIVTSLPVTQGINFLSIYAWCIFRQSQFAPKKKLIFRLKVKKNTAGGIYAPALSIK